MVHITDGKYRFNPVHVRGGKYRLNPVHVTDALLRGKKRQNMYRKDRGCDVPVRNSAARLGNIKRSGGVSPHILH